MSIKYQALIHRHGAMAIECTVCGAIHMTGKSVSNGCGNCKQIAESTLITDETTKHNEEMAAATRGEKVTCKHFALTVDKEPK